MQTQTPSCRLCGRTNLVLTRSVCQSCKDRCDAKAAATPHTPMPSRPTPKQDPTQIDFPAEFRARTEREGAYFAKKRLDRYGLTQEGYDMMFEEQGGLCKICLCVMADTTRGPNIDHDHNTGEVRGLLCGQCNTRLGVFFESPELLEAALRYLQDHG